MMIQIVEPSGFMLIPEYSRLTAARQSLVSSEGRRAYYSVQTQVLYPFARTQSYDTHGISTSLLIPVLAVSISVVRCDLAERPVHWMPSLP